MVKLSIKTKIELIVILLVIICALLGYVITRKVDTFEFEDNATYFVNGIGYKVEAGDKARIDSETNEVTIIRKSGSELETRGLPLYTNNMRDIILINDMALFKAEGSKISEYCLSYFTRISYDDVPSNFKIQRNAKSYIENTGFLFDGKDTYVVLEEVLLSVNGHKELLPAMSYINVHRKTYVEYYNSKIDEYYMEEIGSDEVLIESTSGRFVIHADTDSYTYGVTDVLLQSNVDNYPKLLKEDSES